MRKNKRGDEEKSFLEETLRQKPKILAGQNSGGSVGGDKQQVRCPVWQGWTKSGGERPKIRLERTTETKSKSCKSWVIA